MATPKKKTTVKGIMNDDTKAAITRLLNRAGSAHGAYEESELGGVYDQDWHVWYARWAVAHGFNDLVARPVDAGQLGRLLFDLNKQHQQTDRQQGWAAFTAEKLAARLA